MDEKKELSYTLIRKNVKNINLTVKADGSVVVSANGNVPKTYIDDFVYSKITFIQRARDQVKQNEAQTPDRRFVTGEQITYLGRPLTLHVQQADSRLVPQQLAELQEGGIADYSRNRSAEAVFRRGEQLYLYSRNIEDTAYKQQLYDSWLKIQAGILFERLSRKFYPVFETMGVEYPAIKIRRMKSRWGSCMPQKKKITFNSLLLEKPLESIEYVVVHEFSHFVHPNHSKEFYRFVEQILPDWKERREKLK